MISGFLILGVLPSRGHVGRMELADRFFDAQVSAGDADRERRWFGRTFPYQSDAMGSGWVDTRVTESRRD
jgi:hypothetical protein